MFGKTLGGSGEEPDDVSILGHGFKQSIYMVAAGARASKLDPEIRTEPRDAPSPPQRIDTPVGPVEKPAPLPPRSFGWDRHRKRGEDGDHRRARTGSWARKHLDPGWKLGGERFEVAFDAEPPMNVVFHGLHPPDVTKDLDRNPGIAATAMHCVNAVPAVCRAEPGIRTYLDLPAYSGRAAPDLLP